MEVIRIFQRITLFLFLFTINFETFEPFSIANFSLTKLAGFFYFITIIPEIKFFFRIDQLEKILIFLFLFFLLLTISSLFNVNEFSSSFFNVTIFQNILLFWILTNHSRKDYMILEKGMLFFALGCVVISLFYLANIGVEYEGGRLSMFKENQNTLGIRMNLGIIILLLAVLQNKLNLGKIRFLLLIPIPILMNLLFSSGSRVALISFFLCLVLLTTMLKARNMLYRFLTVLIGIACLIFFVGRVLQSDLLRDRLQQSTEGNLSGRDEIWKNLIPLIRDNFLFGVGQTGYDYYSIVTFGIIRSPHNVILEVICLTGFVGLTIYLLFLFNIFRKSFEIYRYQGSLLPLIFGIPISGLLLSGQILGQKIGWVIFAYIIGSSVVKLQSIYNLSLENANPLRN